MKFRCHLVIFFLIFKIGSFAQTNPDVMLKNFFTSIQQSDTAKFIQYYLTSGEFSEIIKAVVFDSLDEDSLHYKSNINSEVYIQYLIKNEFKNLQRKADSLNINLFKFRYSDCKYQIIKDPEVLFTSLKGSIFFKENNNYYDLAIEEAIYINDKWKVLKLGALSLINDTTVLTKKIITAFNSLNFQIKVIDVKLEDIKGQEPPPPPPPGKPKKKDDK